MATKDKRELSAIEEVAKFNLRPIEAFPGPKVSWRCVCNICENQVYRSLQVLRRSNHPCPFCKSKDFKNSNRLPDHVAVEVMKAAGFEPLEPYVSSGTPWRSQCLKCGEISTPRLGNVKGLNSGCKNCNRNQSDLEEVASRLKKLNLELIGEYVSSRQENQIRCLNCETIFRSTTRRIFDSENPCPNCREEIRKDFIERVNSIFEMAGLTPKVPYKNSSTPRLCVCQSCNREVSPTYNSLKTSKSGCRYCSKLLIDPDDANNLMLSNNLKPLDSFQSGKTPWRSVCLICNSECFPRFANIKSGNGGCQVCALKRRIASRTLSEEVAVQIMKDSGLIPLEPYKSSKDKWLCKCGTCGREVRPMLNTIQQGDGGCGWCSKSIVDPEEALKFMVQNGFAPQIEYPGSNVPWPSKHEACGRISSPRYASIKRGGTCKFCTNKGFQFHLPGYIYLITHSELHAHKVGIASSDMRNDRVKSHVAQGWQLFRTKSFELGDDAYRVEQATLNWLRSELNLSACVSSTEMPQGGWSETVSSDEIDLVSIWDQILSFTKLYEQPEYSTEI